MNTQILLDALFKLRADNPKHEYYLILDREIDGREVAIYECKIKHVDRRTLCPAISRMRLRVQESSTYTVKSVVELFTDKLTQNMKEIYR